MYKKIEFNLARNALKYLVQLCNIKELNIPYYLCDVVRHSLFEVNCKPIFYHIDNNFLPAKNFTENEYILYPNYFGIFDQNIKTLSLKYPNLIVDNAHAFYTKPTGFASFNAGHKFGHKESCLYIKDKTHNDELLIKADESAYKRKEIFIKYHKKYSTLNNLKIDIAEIGIPFVYPYLANTESDADNLVKELKKEGKTVYRYWNPLPKSFKEYEFYSKLVPIPILPEVE